MDILKKKQMEREQLENICTKLKGNFIVKDVALTVEGEGGDPDEIHEGKLILSRLPTEEKPDTTQG